MGSVIYVISATNAIKPSPRKYKQNREPFFKCIDNALGKL